jgi:hypothetical protein
MVSGLIILLLAVVFLVLFYSIFRTPTPGLDRLLLFLVWLAVGALLAYFFAIRVLHYDPDPARLAIARWITAQKIVDLTQVVPGLPEDLDRIYRIDTDGDNERIKDEAVAREWLVVYRYDTVVREGAVVGGPFGAAIYDTALCRPPSLYSFELVPVSYDYLGQDGVWVQVENIIPYKDLLSDPGGEGVDRPEVIITGYTGPTATDLNIFRKVGYHAACEPTRRAHADPFAETVTLPFKYQVIGTFRGTHQVDRSGSTVVVKDRAGFERSQIVIQRVYTPDPGTGSYLVPLAGTDRYVLRTPDHVGLAFGPGRPEDTRDVYYPEKTVLAFFLDLAGNPDRAMSNTCRGMEGGKGKNSYEPAEFGLEVPLSRLESVNVCEMRYVPDDQAERNHETRTVNVKVVETPKGETRDCSQARSLLCIVDPAPNPDALPFGCEWCLYGCTLAP